MPADTRDYTLSYFAMHVFGHVFHISDCLLSPACCSLVAGCYLLFVKSISTLYIIRCTVYTVRCAVRCTYTAHWTLDTTHYTLYASRLVLHTRGYALRTADYWVLVKHSLLLAWAFFVSAVSSAPPRDVSGVYTSPPRFTYHVFH